MLDFGICMGFVTGVMDSRPELDRLCLPHDWDNRNARATFLAWAGRHPESEGMQAAVGIVKAHEASFDCRKSGGGI